MAAPIVVNFDKTKHLSERELKKRYLLRRRILKEEDAMADEKKRRIEEEERRIEEDKLKEAERAKIKEERRRRREEKVKKICRFRNHYLIFSVVKNDWRDNVKKSRKELNKEFSWKKENFF